MCVYIYIWVMSYPPHLLFDHPAIYKTSWQRTVGHHFSNFSNLSNFSTFCKESLGIIFPTVPTFCKESTGYPALDPTANKYISGSGWDIFVISVVFCFSVFL